MVDLLENTVNILAYKLLSNYHIEVEENTEIIMDPVLYTVYANTVL